MSLMFGKKGASPIGAGLAGTHRARYGAAGRAGLIAGKRPPAEEETERGERMVAALSSGAAAPALPGFLMPEAGERASEAPALEGASRAGVGEGDPQLIAMKEVIQPRVLDRIDSQAASALSGAELLAELRPIILEVLAEIKFTLNKRELERLETLLVDELLGLGPLEDLLADPHVADIMVNGPNQVYVERCGKLMLTGVKFRDDNHVLHIAQRICNKVGRRIDQTTPVADARLPDGSRVNVILPPLSLKGPAISIRKFAIKPITLESMVEAGNLSPALAAFLGIASASRLNIIISGGTGSGKTTLLNTLSKTINPGERIVTIEDAAELQLQQPHVVSLEARPPNLDGGGGYTMRDLLINALRMRPDRIILGEVRGAECLDMLQAMNTGHEGSMCTLHANRPREAITRMENMVTMAGVNYPLRAIRQQIVDAVDLIVQVRRMRDGVRRITSVTEVVGLDEEMVQTQELFSFDYQGETAEGRILGAFSKSGLRPHCYDKICQQGLERALLEALA
ncbi:MAG: CpaF family protein [Pseudomonadota bacterium]